jgi:hypothetical protein
LEAHHPVSGCGLKPPTTHEGNMNQHLKAYAWFLAFAVATKVFVAPMAKTMNIPFVKDL